MAHMPRWVVAVGSVVVVAVLVVAAVWASRSEEAADPVSAASSVAPDSSATPALPTPSVEPTPPIVIWAGEVCEARDVFLASVVEVAGTLEFDPNDPASIGEQFQQQIPGQLDGVQAAAENLGTALGGVPLDYVDAAAALSTLNDRVTELSTAKDEALAHVDAARNADNPVSAGVEWLQAAKSAKDTYDAGIAVKDALGQLTDSADGDLGDAFDTAPRCQGVSLG